MWPRVLLFPIAFSVLILKAAPLKAGEWPKDYIVREDSESPDGRYALLVQTADAADQQNSNESDVYLADVKAHTTLGSIDKVDYFEHQNHRDLEVFWAPDSSYCVVENDGRYGMDTLSVLEIKDSKFVQTEIGERIQKSLDGAMKKQSHERDIGGDVSPHFRLRNDRKIRVRASSQNNPKQFDNVKTYYALFQGTYDLAAKKWTVTDARLTNSEQDDALQPAYDDSFAKHMIVAADDKQVPENFTGSVFRSEKEKFDALDERLNQVYQAVRSLLPPNRFAKVKQEQLAWVKTRDVAKSVEEKSKLTEDRIKALQDLLW
ncbi:MAG TPA: lysozyme inhibitor LprI family protein [Chthoniobacterales bacterium]|jgi:hypothetical protein|nr:lysozyme inhibitor LprI family protein [Chthoniobacterales bacterium]